MRNPQLPRVAVITPTYKRDVDIIDRCVRSVGSQSYDGMIIHIICSDGPEEEHVKTYVESLEDPSVAYICTGENTNSYGGGVREYVLKNFIEQYISLDYLVHLDDDNVLFPHFIERHVDALERNPEKGFSICRIIHLGPLPQHLGPAPQVINGIPPVFQNIDTLQVVVRRDAMIKCRWNTFSGEKGYYNDGYTYQRLGELFDWIEIPEILGVHI
jgi:cellulose synthase/poly-beta-1,6-N-acetylglucosamine synthase-like glycosyltransferase